MRVILDTNVFMSGIFWAGPPARILEAWQKNKFKLILSSEILDEYVRVGQVLSKKYKGIDVSPFIDLAVMDGELYESANLAEPVSRDPDDDKFIACALGADCKLIVSGDKDLLDIKACFGISIIKPSEFVAAYL